MKNYSLLALMFSILMFMIVSCGDNGTNTITPKNKPGQLGGTSWKFIAFVDGETGNKDNPFYKIDDFDNIPESYFNNEKYNFTVAFLKNSLKILDLEGNKYAINLVAYSSSYARAEGEYNLTANSNSFEKFYLVNQGRHSEENDAIYMLSLIKTKSFKLKDDTLMLYKTPDSTGDYMIFRKIVLEIPDNPFNPSVP